MSVERGATLIDYYALLVGEEQQGSNDDRRVLATHLIGDVLHAVWALKLGDPDYVQADARIAMHDELEEEREQAQTELGQAIQRAYEAWEAAGRPGDTPMQLALASVPPELAGDARRKARENG